MPATALKIAAYSALGLTVAEAGLNLLVSRLRRGYQWLITARDEVPGFDRPALEKFFCNGFDPELGWTRKPVTSGVEQGRNGQVFWHVDHRGSRVNPGFENAPAAISCYGDSFAFCRQVADDQTWEHYLSRITGQNVLNFGVGNYGLDQAVLRCEREYDSNPTPVVILAVVPETISRILGVWKHYHEYGNTFAFKPRFRLDGEKLELIPNVMDSPDKFDRLEEYLPLLRKNDYFYSRKFRRDMLRFPMLWNLARSAKRNIPLMARLIRAELGFGGQGYRDHLHDVSVLRRNIELCADLYQRPEILDLFCAILQRFADFCRSRGASPMFMILPQLNDLKLMQKRGNFYSGLAQRAGGILPTLDMAAQDEFADQAMSLYSNDSYGGHLSAQGNEVLANIIHKSVAGLADAEKYEEKVS